MPEIQKRTPEDLHAEFGPFPTMIGVNSWAGAAFCEVFHSDTGEMVDNVVHIDTELGEAICMATKDGKVLSPGIDYDAFGDHGRPRITRRGKFGVRWAWRFVRDTPYPTVFDTPLSSSETPPS